MDEQPRLSARGGHDWKTQRWTQQQEATWRFKRGKTLAEQENAGYNTWLLSSSDRDILDAYKAGTLEESWQKSLVRKPKYFCT